MNERINLQKSSNMSRIQRQNMMRILYKSVISKKFLYVEMDKYIVRPMLSPRLNETIIILESKEKVGYFFKFSKSNDNKYRCCSCLALGKYRTITVVENEVKCRKNPEDDHHPDCKPIAESELEAKVLDREMRSAVRQTGKRPREAYTEAVTSISKKFKTADQQEDVIINFPSYNEVRCQLSRHRMVNCIPVPDQSSLPEGLQVTLRARNASDGNPNKEEKFLLHTSEDGKLKVFCAATELALIQQSEFLICDGTFEMAPDSSYQLYTIHGFFKGESMALLWALLPDKKKQTYLDLFGVLRSALIENFGDIVAHHRFLTDFEIATIEAIQAVFPESDVKGCTFHFRQAIIRHLNQEGLKTVYNEDTHPEVKSWIRQIMAMSLLPAFLVEYAWANLKYPPVTQEADLNLRIEKFKLYVENTWINGSYPPTLWTHFDNDGPRTTNVAEGWHNGINSHFGMSHPSLRSFMDWIQKCQFEVQCRGIQLKANRNPKKRAKKYIELDKRISKAKVDFGIKYGYIFACVFPDPSSIPQLMDCIKNYLTYVVYLLVGND